MKKIIRNLKKIFFYPFTTLGIISFIYIIFAFTSIPYNILYKQGIKFFNETIKPDYIIMMGAGGMPEKNNLIRQYYAVNLLKKFPESTLIIALPGNINDTNSSIYILYKDFLDKNISKDRILIENIGVNTRSQAINILKILKEKEHDLKNINILIVTSPEHIPRSILSFRKLGITKSYGYPAFSYDLESNLIFSHKETQGIKILTSIGGSIKLRYRFWEYIKIEISLTREYLALIYYKINGWI